MIVAVLRQAAHDLVRRYLNEPFNALCPSGVKKHLGADDIGLQKLFGGVYAAVNVRFGGKVKDRVAIVGQGL